MVSQNDQLLKLQIELFVKRFSDQQTHSVLTFGRYLRVELLR